MLQRLPIIGLAIHFFRSSLVVRYVFSGGISAALDIGILFVLTHYVGIYYLASAIIALTISFITRFLLQKFVTFRDESESDATRQFVYYCVLYALSMMATTTLLYLFVEKLHVWYVFAQILTIGIIACVSFFVYKVFIFKDRGSDSSLESPKP